MFRFDPILNQLFPAMCARCGDTHLHHHVICSNCIDLLQPASPFARFQLHRNALPMFKHVIIPYQFDTVSQSFVHLLKYAHQTRIAEIMASAIAAQMPTTERPEWIIPCPLHPRKKQEREFNQALEIAIALSRITGLPVTDQIIQRNRYTRSQTILTRTQRDANLNRVFQANRVDAQHVLIVDDIITTGATVQHIRSALIDVNPGLIVSAAGFASPVISG